MPINHQDQMVFLIQLKNYLNIAASLRPDVYRPNDVATLNSSLTQGHCSGITALWLYYKRNKKEKYFYDSIMQPILAWDGTKENLSKELEETIEYALSSVAWLQASYEPFTQAISGMVSHSETKYEQPAVLQSDYDILLSSIKQKKDQTLRKEYEIAFVFKNEELKEFLEGIGADKSVRLGSSDHAIGLVHESDTQEYVLFDSNGFWNEQTQERFFEKRFSSDKVEDLIKHIQSAFLYEPDSEVTGLTISIFDDSEKPMPTYLDRVELIKQKLEERIENKNSISINQGGYDGASPLWLAAQASHIDTVQFLLQQGAAIEQRNKKNCSIIQLLSSQGNEKILELVLDTVTPSDAQYFINELFISDEFPPVYYAAQGGHIETVRLLLRKGAQVTFETLQESVRNRHIKVLELLLSSSKESLSLINFQAEDMPSLLYIAAENGYIEIVEFLLKQGAKIQGEKLRNPIDIAIINGHDAVAKLLLNAPEAQNVLIDQKDTSLELIIQYGRFEILKWLLKEKRNAQQDQSRALRVAIREGQVKMVQWLLQQGVKIGLDSSELELAVQYGHNTVLELLLDSQAQALNSQESGKKTLLHIATAYNHPETVALLLNRGGVVSQNEQGWNPIHIAVKRGGKVDCIKVFLDFEAQKGENRLIDMPTRNGETPLFLAASCNDIKTVQFLLSRGAKIDTSNSAFNPILSASKHRRGGALVKILESALEQQVSATISAVKSEKSEDLAATIHIDTETKSSKPGI